MKFIFFGSSFISSVVLETLCKHHTLKAVVSIPSKPSGRGYKIKESPVIQLARTYKIPIFQGIPSIQDLPKADVGVVLSFGKILPLSILQFFPMGCINIHVSLLPKWRGAAPMQRSLLQGDSKVGISLMQMDEGLDTGAVLNQWSMDRLPLMNIFHMERWFAYVASCLMLDYLSSPMDFFPMEQHASQASIAKKIKKQEYTINWNATAWAILRKILAFYPYTYTLWQGKRLRILEATIIKPLSHTQEEALKNSTFLQDTLLSIVSGMVVDLDPFVIATGEGFLRILSVQLEGKQETSIKNFLLGHKCSKGMVLGS